MASDEFFKCGVRSVECGILGNEENLKPEKVGKGIGLVDAG
ncbi:MAG TPA: hypothetical protein PLP86_05095 [Armatimonadota bacterium]|nr:hypothetical protein [Armatimonadota bacterium]